MKQIVFIGMFLLIIISSLAFPSIPPPPSIGGSNETASETGNAKNTTNSIEPLPNEEPQMNDSLPIEQPVDEPTDEIIEPAVPGRNEELENEISDLNQRIDELESEKNEADAKILSFQKQNGFLKMSLIGIIALFILVISILLIRMTHHKPQPDLPSNAHSNIQPNAQANAQSNIQSDNSVNVQTSNIQTYFNTYIKQGYTREYLVDYLEKQGYKKEIILDAIKGL
ncbi:MAG: hypothetical protein NDI94_01425 [Candidatus Woesearchaeota archaeon]|nr:hypothetical protein [Candidatus Woesearchaeota archaeon]